MRTNEVRALYNKFEIVDNIVTANGKSNVMQNLDIRGRRTHCITVLIVFVATGEMQMPTTNQGCDYTSYRMTLRPIWLFDYCCFSNF